MSETMLSQDRLDKSSLYLIFGAKSEDGNRLVWIAQTGLDRVTFYRCSRVNNASKEFETVEMTNLKDLCTHQDIKLHHAYRLRKDLPLQVIDVLHNGGGALFDFPPHLYANAEHNHELLCMLMGKEQSCGTGRSTTIAWLASLLHEPLIACNLELELGQDIKKPRLAEEVATKLFDHGNKPQTEQRVFTLTEVVKSKKEWKCIVS
ncbi:hypothetical protein DFH11DRAFT_1549301 [Phellopilus nigrolimitatus]|nr:hypothetical protein DFH11DRAFT_1549301 [Phellopilus nigrolimitatus]